MSAAVAKPDSSACAATPAKRLANELAQWSSYAMAILLLAGAATLWCRRLAAALQQPLGWPGLILAGAMAACTGAGARTCFRRAAPVVATRPAAGVFEWFVTVCLAAWGLAVSFRGASAGGMVLFWGILAAEELWAWWNALGLDRRLGGFRIARGAEGYPEAGAQTHAVAETSEVLVGQRPQSPPILGEAEVLQQFVRSRQRAGGEVLSGWMRVPLSPRQRNVAVHLAFCPPFPCIPTITVAQQEGPAARIKEAQVLPFGARLDLKLLQEIETAATVLLEIVVRADPPADAASPAELAKSQFGHLWH